MLALTLFVLSSCVGNEVITSAVVGSLISVVFVVVVGVIVIYLIRRRRKLKLAMESRSALEL